MPRTSTLRAIIAPATRFIADEQGATAIEYAMIAAGVGAFISATVFGVGSGLKTNFYDKLAALFP
jgi:pilus assembly protein Flp/PilA